MAGFALRRRVEPAALGWSKQRPSFVDCGMNKEGISKWQLFPYRTDTKS
jgi:hypothetical protein